MLKTLAKQFIEQLKAKDVFAAMKTLAVILDKGADTGKLLFGTAAEEDLEVEFAELTEFRGELMRACSCGDGSCLTVGTASEVKPENIGLWIALVDVVLKIIAARRNKQ